MKTIDMSEKAVMRRLRQVDQLRDLCLSLMKAKQAHDEKMREAENNGQNQNQNSKEPLRDTDE